MHLLKFSCCISFFINCSFAFTFITLPIINPNYNRNLHKNTSFNNRYNKNYHHNFNNNNNYHYNNIKNNNYNNNFKNDYINSESVSNDHNGDNQSNEYINRKNILTSTTTTAKTIGLETDNPNQITKNYDNDDNNNNNNYETVSFGIRSFTVEITPPTEKPSININPNNANVNLEKLKGSMEINTKTINHNNVLFTSTSEPSMAMTSTKSSSTPLQPSSSSSSSSSLPSLELSSVIHNSKENQNEEDSNDNIKLNNNEHSLGNGMHIEKQLKNGLYRIKIAEIITDEFDNGLGDINSVDNERKSIENLHKQNINNNDNNENIINNNNNRNRNKGKINIADLYPSKLEDFTSIIKDSNEKIINNKNFVNNDKNNRQNDAQLQQQQHPSHQKVNVLNQQIDNSTNVIEQQQQIQEGNDPLYTLIENNIPTTKIEIELIDEINSNNSVAVNSGGGRSEIDDNIQNQTTQINIINYNNVSDDIIKAKSTQINLNITDFTSQLQQNDGVISTIENDFKNNINDLKKEPSAVTVPTLLIPTTPTPTPTRTTTKTTTASTIQFNKDIGHIYFIDRRVKKNKINYRETPQNDIQRIDSPITRFTNNNHNIEQNLESSQQQQHQSSLDVNKNEKPEFSTTKFYNSKELYNELLHKNLDEDAAHDFENNTNSTNNNNEPIKFETTTLPSSSITSAPNVSTGLQSSSLSSTPPSPILTTTTTITSTTTLPFISNSKKPFQITIFNINVPKNSSMDKQKQNHQNTISTTMFTANTPLSTSTSSSFDNSNTNNSLPLSSSNKNNIKTNESLILMENQSELQQQNKDEIEVKEKPKPNKKITMQHLNVLLSNRSNNSNNKNIKKIILEKSAKQQHKLDSVKSNNSSDKGVGDSLKDRKNNEPKKILTRLQEKINSLECDIQYLSQDSHVWRGNETHELNLPNTLPKNCGSGLDCLPMIVSWEGIAEIQSGDVLLVEIDDTLLIPASNHDTFNSTTSNDSNLHKSNTAAVYQVTRPGHEHCDVTEGILLDITPLVVDGKKLVTLYDKDLTEGVNLLIVVSELWARQCVRLKVTVKSDNCGENAECSGKGVCFSNTSMEGYECQCCAGYAGSHCEEIDACTPSPCTNNGICVDLSQGHEGNSYQCLCPYGYTGKNCQFESDPCNPSECLNGGSCVGNVTHFRCECAAGFTGPLCQHNLNECESSPCVHGICVDQEDGFRCFCQPGFAGELCNFEYNECESNPCLNGGQCTDQIGGFSCTCTRGYAGKRCHIKLDFCSNNPCPEGHRCNDRGDDFICECPSGRNGPDCNEVPRTLCNVNPCSNGGTCWTSEDSFYCACRPGFTGKMCEDEFIVETVVSSSEIISDDPSTNTRTFSAVVSTSKGTIGLHNAYIAAGTFATAIFIVAIVVVISQCKFSKSYRQFTTKHHQLIPILGFNIKRRKSSGHRHWLSGKGNIGAGGGSSGNNISAASNCNNTTSGMKSMTSVQLLHQHNNNNTTAPSNTNINGNAKGGHHTQQHRNQLNRHLAMNLENDMYYTVDFSDSQNSPLIQ